MFGIDVELGQNGAICFHVSDFSEALKTEIRSRLSLICYGVDKATGKSDLYAYRNTLSVFLKRYNSKSLVTQKGMIGELLTHIILLDYDKNYVPASPFFNMEESSIKKGFDLVLHRKTDNEIWYVEVKSGECGAKSASAKLQSLLGIASASLSEAFDSNREALWQNAINGASIVFGDTNIDLKKIIKGTLEDINLSANTCGVKSSDFNAVLVAVCYVDKNIISNANEFDAMHSAQCSKKKFKDLISVSIQKSTYQKVVDFMMSEAA